jgi:Type II secretion system (T2SS), protein E, N-terminal domain
MHGSVDGTVEGKPSKENAERASAWTLKLVASNWEPAARAMTLSSFIVSREVATMRQVEEALAHQVIYGGDLATNLLEVAPVDEDALTQVLAEATKLAPAPSGALPVAPAPAQLVPAELAVQRGIVPLGLEDEILVLAVIEPLPTEIEEQLMFALGLAIDQRVAPAVRVHEAIARLYGLPLDRRMRRLVARLSGDPVPAGTTPVPTPARGVMAARRSPVSPAIEAEPPSPPAAVPVARIALAADRVERRAASVATAASSPGGAPVRHRPSPIFPATQPSARAFDAIAAVVAAAEPSPPRKAQAAPVRDPRATDVSRPDPPMTPVVAERGPGLLQREIPPSVRPARRRRGPITLAAAHREADELSDRDVLLGLFFDFSRQFFDYAALFLVHGDIAEGRDAFGAGATRERVLGIGVPLDLPSVLATARAQRKPVVATAPADGLDAVLLADLQRPRDGRMAVVPVVVRNRVVALLLGDCGDASVERDGLQQVAALSAVVGKALERIIVRRKIEGLALPPGRSSDPAALAASPPGPDGSNAPPSQPSQPPPIRVAVSEMPPPPANVVTVRRVSGPPIPREEPEELHATLPPGHPLAQTFRSAGNGLPAGAEGLAGSYVPSPPPPAVEIAPQPAERPREPAAVPPPAAPDADEPLPADVPIDEELDARALFDMLGWETGAEEPERAPPSSAMAVPPHLPPLGHAAPPEALPSVIVDIDQELAAIVDRVVSGDADESAEGELLRQGERAMKVIMARFPGPVTVDRARVASAVSPPRASECGPILRLVARERRVALPFVIARLGDPDPDTRGWATHLLCELPYAEAIPRALERLCDSDACTRASAAHAIAAVSKVLPDLTRDAVKELARAPAAAERAAAMRAIARLRQSSLVPELIGGLDDGDERVVAAAHEALVQVTCQDLGSSPRVWLKWWEDNGSRHRIEWLIDALAHDVSEIRRAAGQELRAITREYFGDSSDLPPRDRDRTRQRYRDWWITEGRARFRRRP